MFNLDTKLNDTELIIKLIGRIDSSNSAQVEDSVKKTIEINKHNSIVFDVEDLEYISSAGLRIVLRTRKNEPTLKIVNAKPDVYEIFDMTGFTEMMPVEKAYRHISIDGCDVIGKGATGKVYRIDPETIVKCYYKKDALAEIQRERELSRKAFILGIPTAISYDVVKVDDGYGAVFELLNADLFVSLIVDNPEKIDSYIEYLVDLLKKFHSTDVAPQDVPSKKEIGIKWVKQIYDLLPEPSAKKLLTMFEELEDSNKLMHGDFHIKNVMMQNDEALLIDMDTLSRGNAVFEFGAMFNAYIAYSDLDKENSMNFFGVPFEITEYLFNKSLEMYFENYSEEELSLAYKKAALVGYTNMVKTFVEDNEDEKSIEYYKNKLIELIDKVDSIAF